MYRSIPLLREEMHPRSISSKKFHPRSTRGLSLAQLVAGDVRQCHQHTGTKGQRNVWSRAERTEPRGCKAADRAGRWHGNRLNKIQNRYRINKLICNKYKELKWLCRRS